jgi:hypothetical protein
MADKSKVAEAYAEVRADLTKLPADLATVPSLIKRMISTDGLKAVRDLVTGNVSSGLAAIATRGYELQAQKLRDIAKAALEAKKNLDTMAAVHEQKAGDKSLSKGDRDKAASMAQALREKAARKQATADALTGQAEGLSKTGASVGGKVGLIANVGMLAIKGVAAVAAAYLAATVVAAHKASEQLKTSQLVRATGETAGWTAKQLEHMGEVLRKNSKFSEGAIAGAQSELLKRPNIKGGEFKQALDTAANLASVMGTELPQAAAELGDLLADPIKAAEGGLEKYGILLNGLQQGQIKNAMAARDWAKAQQLVLGHLSKFNGAAKEAGETGAGGFEKLKNSVLAAVASIGGANGDIGLFAARVAKAIDTFMSLQIVKDIIDALSFQWRMLSSVVEAFISGNSADIEKWGDLISETYHNVRDQVLEVWAQIKEVAKEASDFILSVFGTSWQEIKDVVTSVLDEMSILTANFKLTAQYAWIAIQLAAQEAWDGIRDGLSGLAVAFEATWAAVVKGAEAAWDQIEKAFSGEATKSIADEMAKGFRDGLTEGAKKYNFGDSEAAKKLKADLANVRKEMVAARDEIRDKRAAAKEAEKKKMETPGKGGDYVNTKPFKYEFVGFEELSKKIQTSLYPTEAIQLQRAGVNAAERAVNNGNEANRQLGRINENLVRGVGFAP